MLMMIIWIRHHFLSQSFFETVVLVGKCANVAKSSSRFLSYMGLFLVFTNVINSIPFRPKQLENTILVNKPKQ